MEFRPAELKDAGRIRDISRDIWEGNDYLPAAIEGWLAEGGVYVGTADGEVVGLSRIKRLGDDDWWLEGLRVAPEHQGKGYGRLLHRATMSELGRIGRGTVRFCTADTNRSVPLARRDGFRAILDLPFLSRSFAGEETPPPAEALAQNCVRLASVEEPGLVELLLETCRREYSGLLPQGWHHFTATEEALKKAWSKARLLVRGGVGAVEAVLVVNPSIQYGEDLDLDLVAGPPAVVAERLLPCVGPLAAQSGRLEAGGAVPERFLKAFLAAGFRVPEGFTRQVVFELRLP